MKLYNLPFYGVVYRSLMRFTHKFNWHYAPVLGPIDPGSGYQRWCKWCGMREGYRYDPRIPATELKRKLADIDKPKSGEKRSESICARCGELIKDNEPYASMGGNIEPYIPAKLFHVECIPTVQEMCN